MEKRKKQKQTTGQMSLQLDNTQKEYEILNPSESAEELEKWEKWNQEAFENYEYFKFKELRKNWNFPAGTEKKAVELLEQKKIQVKSIQFGYGRGAEALVEAYAMGKERAYPFEIHLVVGREKVLYAECDCYQCNRNYYVSHYNGSRCAFIYALLEKVQKHVEQNRLGDATDYGGQLILGAFSEQRANRVVASSAAKQNSMQLVPRLVKACGKLQLSFRVGESKLYVVKNLPEFIENVKNSRMATYGNNTELNHQRSNFTKESQNWIDFIERSFKEVNELEKRVQDSGGYLPKSIYKQGSIELHGWKLDDFYEYVGKHPIDFENKDNPEEGKGHLVTGVGNPSVQLTIRRTKPKKGNAEEFQGITVSGKLPKFYQGVGKAYYLTDRQLIQLEDEFLKKIQLLSRLAGAGEFSFQIGRNHLADFYYTVLPQLEGVVEVFEEDSEEIQKYLPPQGKIIFYLDAADSDIVCRIGARYGQKEFDASDSVNFRATESFRERMREQEAVYIARNWFPEYQPETGEYSTGQDTDRVYSFLQEGLEVLLNAGEVQCTSRFRSMGISRKLNLSVGISVSQGLLNLNIATEDISKEEMEEILGSYRAKKKYHQLKNGSFLSMADESVATLEELTRALRMSVTELLQEEVQLPLYRALYVDKVLEKNEEIYSNRDNHFRKIIKSFKTVKDSDFEVPEQLQKIMRGYQKYGYQWLRTLEEYQMGGILADDMGLGKTLQAIAVLLAAKKNGRKGTSLIVTTASLVFNWGEELRRFAPELKAELITGTQEERKQKLKQFGKADVFVTSYDLLKRDIASYHDKVFEYQIIDEAQYIKNHSTAAAKAVKVVESRTRFALTGTPMENRLSELWSIFDYLMPGYLYGYETFRKEFESPIVRGEDENAMGRLKKMTSPFILRRLKEQVLKDLPEKLEEHRYVKLSGEQKKLYDAQVQYLKQTIASQDAEEFQKNKLRVLAEITKIRQICCDPGLCFENYKGESAKLEACMDLIESAMEGGHRMLVFSQFTSMLDILKKKLEEQKIPYFTITGDVPKEKRLQLVKEFNEGDVPVFLISLKAGGVGLNLTGADVVIHYDPWWNLAAQNQATDRAHRIGQTKKVVVYKLLAKDSMEEKIQKIQESKKQLSDQIVQGDTNQLSEMSREDFLALFE